MAKASSSSMQWVWAEPPLSPGTARGVPTSVVFPSTATTSPAKVGFGAATGWVGSGTRRARGLGGPGGPSVPTHPQSRPCAWLPPATFLSARSCSSVHATGLLPAAPPGSPRPHRYAGHVSAASPLPALPSLHPAVASAWPPRLVLGHSLEQPPPPRLHPTRLHPQPVGEMFMAPTWMGHG